MTTWLTPVNAQVKVQKVGNSYLFLFPATQGRTVAKENPAGKIAVGKTISVAYALKVMGGKSRFILLDGTKAGELMPKLSTEQVDKLFGFQVKDTKQPLLNVYIDPSFMQKAPPDSKALLEGERVAREGNLDVIIGKEGKDYKIIAVRLN